MKDIRTILIILLSVILMATWAFYIYDKSQPAEQYKEKIITDSTEFKKAVQQAVEDSLKKVYAETKRDTVYVPKDSLQQQQMPAEDSMNSIAASSESEKMGKNEKSKIAGASLYFIASGINLAAITTRAGDKPEVTSVAKESEKFILSFMLQNKVLPTSEYTIYVVVTQPDQKIIRSSAAGKDYFIAGKEGWKPYSQKIRFFYIHKSKKTVTCILRPGSFMPGVYTVKIFHNGKMIGMASKQLQ